MSTFLNCLLFFTISCYTVDMFAVVHSFFLCARVLFCGCSTFSHLYSGVRECVGMSSGKKTFVPRKQCFYSNCYSVAHSWHYFPTLIKFHPNHNSNHVGALLQSLSNMRIITIEPVVIIVFGCTIYIRVPTHTPDTYMHTYLHFWHFYDIPQKPIPYIHYYIFICWMGNENKKHKPEKKAKKSLGWSTTVVCFILGCV